MFYRRAVSGMAYLEDHRGLDDTTNGMESVFSESTCHGSNLFFGGHVAFSNSQLYSFLFNAADEFLGLVVLDPRPGDAEDLLGPIFCQPFNHGAPNATEAPDD
jgi:hypothetical protein